MRVCRPLRYSWSVALLSAWPLAAWGETPIVPAESEVLLEESPQIIAGRLFSQGLQYVKTEQYAEALSAFQQAHDLSPHPRALFNIAHAYERLYRLEEAISAYRKYLAETDEQLSEDHRERLKERIERLEAAVDRQTSSVPQEVTSTLDVHVDCPYPGFELRAGGKTRATSPLQGWLTLPLTTRTLSFQRAGYQTETHPVPRRASDVVACHPVRRSARPGDQTGELKLSLTPRSARLTINGEQVTHSSALTLPQGRHFIEVAQSGYASRQVLIDITPGELHTDEISLRSLTPQEPEPVSPWTASKIAGVSLAGVGAALAGTTVGVYAWNDRRHAAWQSERKELQSEPLDTQGLAEARSDNNDELQRIQRTDTTTWVLGTTAAAFLTAGAFAYFFVPSNESVRVAAGLTTLQLEANW